MASAMGSYREFIADIQTAIPLARIICDPLRTLAYGTDASFYRLIPQLVVKVVDEQEVRKLALEPRRLLANVFFGLAAIAALAALLALLEDAAGRLWVGTASGLAVLTRPEMVLAAVPLAFLPGLARSGRGPNLEPPRQWRGILCQCTVRFVAVSLRH